MWCRQSLLPTAGLLSGPLVATQATALTTIALPKLPSAAACACLSPRNILSPFGQAWKDGKTEPEQDRKRNINGEKKHMEKDGKSRGKGASEDWRVPITGERMGEGLIKEGWIN